MRRSTTLKITKRIASLIESFCVFEKHQSGVICRHKGNEIAVCDSFNGEFAFKTHRDTQEYVNAKDCTIPRETVEQIHNCYAERMRTWANKHGHTAKIDGYSVIIDGETFDNFRDLNEWLGY